jgi:hypothetical protein
MAVETDEHEAVAAGTRLVYLATGISALGGMLLGMTSVSSPGRSCSSKAIFLSLRASRKSSSVRSCWDRSPAHSSAESWPTALDAGDY